MLYLYIIAFLLLLTSYLYPATKGFSEKSQNFKVIYLLTTNTVGWLSYIYLFAPVVLEALAMI